MQHQFEDLKVWQKAMELVKAGYKISQGFPKEEQYGLTGQLRRALVSVPVNVAEGKGRSHSKEYVQFLYMARGSIYESMTLIHLSRDLGYTTKDQATRLLSDCSEVTAMLNGLIQAVR